MRCAPAKPVRALCESGVLFHIAWCAWLLLLRAKKSHCWILNVWFEGKEDIFLVWKGFLPQSWLLSVQATDSQWKWGRAWWRRGDTWRPGVATCKFWISCHLVEQQIGVSSLHGNEIGPWTLRIDLSCRKARTSEIVMAGRPSALQQGGATQCVWDFCWRLLVTLKLQQQLMAQRHCTAQPTMGKSQLRSWHEQQNGIGRNSLALCSCWGPLEICTVVAECWGRDG